MSLTFIGGIIKTLLWKILFSTYGGGGLPVFLVDSALSMGGSEVHFNAKYR